MKKIKINMTSKKSVDKAIKMLRQQQKDIEDKIVPEILKESAIWIIDKANEYIDKTLIGIDVKADIRNSWQYTVDKTSVIVRNTAEKAVYVEFGTGIVGKNSPHELARENNYHYDTDTLFKDDTRAWEFYKPKDELDIPMSAVISSIEAGGSGMWFRTRGAKNVSYAFNALMDFKDYGLRDVWEKIRKKYWS